MEKTEVETQSMVQIDPAPPVTRLFTIVERDSDTYIQIPNEKLRHFIWNQMDDQTLVNAVHLYQKDDSDIVKIQRDRGAVFLLDEAIQQWFPWFEEYGTRLFDEDCDLMDDVCDQYAAIHKAIIDLGGFLLESRTKLLAENEHVLAGNDVTFARLFYALQKKDLTLCVNHENTRYAGQVRRVSYQPANMFTPRTINVELVIYVHTGKRLKQFRSYFTVVDFEGVSNLKDLGITVITDEVKRELVERGKRYIALTANPSHVAYKGSVVRRNWYTGTEFRASGRVMVDMLAMRTIDPNYRHYFALGSSRDEDDRASTEIPLTDDVLMCTSPYVYGFSFSAKVWGEMLVDNISDIKFRTDAYDRLVLDNDIKEMLIALVDNPNSTGHDFIDGKGGGTIFLLAGSPGVGKTLTAEAIAEKLQQPLYMVGVGELGTDVEALEKHLRDILDIATSWGAVLLLDEADIFMEERDDVNIERNAMVGVFLRMLEYYQGTLFLTTNRAKSIDDAFYSRISLAIKYEDLTEDNRNIIWSNILGLYTNEADVDLSHVDIFQLAKFDINGRQIKNVARIVISLANRAGTIPTTADFTKVINHVMKFKKDA